LDKNKDLYVQIYGNDALWVDRFAAWHPGWDEWTKEWGSSNTQGWCLSTDRNDHLDWNHDDYAQHVTAGQCYYQVKLATNGNVYGWHSSAPLMCRKKKKMNCKQGCPRGWKHISTSDHGCCKSWDSCGGNRKTCQGDEKCRRRFEEADADVTFEVLPQAEEDGHWVLLSGQKEDNVTRSDLSDRLSQAELPEDETTETAAVQDKDTKHFVLEDGEWVELSEEEAKGMSTTDSEEADEVLSEVTEDARRRVQWPGRFPGWPSGLKICKDVMEMPCNMPCLGGGWSLDHEIEDGCCMRGPGSPGQPKNCGYTTKVCKKVYLCRK